MTQPDNFDRLQDDIPNDPADLAKNDERKLKDRPVITNGELQEIFSFTGVELNANRMGRFSAEQRAALAANVQEEVNGMWLMLMILLGTGVLITLIVSPAGERTLPLIVGIGGVLAAFMAYSYRRQGRARTMSESQRVRQLDGKPTLQLGRLNTAGGGSVVVGDRTLRVPTDQLMLLSAYYLPYMRLYYTQEGGQIISAEVLSRPDDLSAQPDQEADDQPATLTDSTLTQRGAGSA